MKALYECRDVVERQWLILSTEYGKTYPRSAYDQLVRKCAHVEPPVFEEAIERHMMDATEESPGKIRGKWAPKTADVFSQVAKIRDEHRAVEQNRRFESNKTYTALTKGDQPQLERAICKECSDRGMTAFYYMPRDLSKVWLKSEALVLDELIFGVLGTASAVCDCKAGMSRYERQWIFTDDKGSSRPTIPRMESIRDIAKRRRSHELQPVGAAPEKEDYVS